ncbi:LysR family transcriptional regulator [Pseudonocardia sp. HH130630-07]|uniref:LysR family transcriptional regulator n=1 Tax=Pseudonocardia sp. HH130630-07 TaxID=1690815 RepID=UPI00081531C9|nr:LysR family transcriptional regulator [Pseudonocardia sp. HH130630-07]ANY08326.1 hypothetical protein AFB00_20905 [Pseudonocardia sp. HH130630-07]
MVEHQPRRAGDGRAARETGLSQPSASLRIAELERRIGSPLVERSPTGSRLTGAGTTVAGWATRLVTASKAFDQQVASLQDPAERRLTVAVSKTVADYLLPDWLVTMHEIAPEVTVALELRDAADVAEQVRDGSSEIGFTEGTGTVHDLRSCGIGHDELLVLTAPGHRLTREDPLCLDRLATEPLLLRETGCGSRATLEQTLAGAGLTPTVGAELASTAAIKSLVVGGSGVTVLSGLSVRADLDTGALVALPLREGPIELPFRAVWRRGAHPVGPARRLVEIAVRAGARRAAGPRTRTVTGRSRPAGRGR